MRQVGAMEDLYQTYKDVAEFRIVYIQEAHAANSNWPSSNAKKLGIMKHKTYGDRCAVAGRMIKDKKLTIPCLIDNLDNKVSDAYKGWPDRVYLVRTDGRLAVAGGRGPWGFEPALQGAGTYLARYKKTGRQPPSPKPPADTGSNESKSDKDRGQDRKKRHRWEGGEI